MSAETGLHPLVGHERIREALGRAAQRGTLPATLLLHGPSGVGKQRMALWLGQALMCASPTVIGGCGECTGCRMALRLEHPDLHWTLPLPRPRNASTPEKLSEALEEARLEAVKRARTHPLSFGDAEGDEDRPRGIYMAAVQRLREEARKPPSMAPRRLFLIAEAQFLVPQESSPEAANALLKLLEEPPPHATFVLTSSHAGRLLPTIRSRTVPVHLGPLPRATVEAFLVERLQLSPDAARSASTLAEGSIGRALGFLPPAGGGTAPLERLREEARSLLEAALPGRGDRGMRLAAALGYGSTGARGLIDLLTALEAWLRDLAAAAAGSEESILNQDRAPWLLEIARRTRVHPASLDRARDAVDRTRELAAGNVNPQLLLAGLLREMAQHLQRETSA